MGRSKGVAWWQLGSRWHIYLRSTGKAKPGTLTHHQQWSLTENAWRLMMARSMNYRHRRWMFDRMNILLESISRPVSQNKRIHLIIPRVERQYIIQWASLMIGYLLRIRRWVKSRRSAAKFWHFQQFLTTFPNRSETCCDWRHEFVCIGDVKPRCHGMENESECYETRGSVNVMISVFMFSIW